MKILILSSVGLDSGTGLRVSGIAEALAKLGHEVYLTGSCLTERLPHVNYLAIKKRCGIRKYVFSMLSNIRFSKMVKADVIIASKAHPVSCLPAMLAKGKAKLILDFDDLEHTYWKNPFKIAFFMAAEKFFAKNFDYVTTHNENLKKYISRKLGLKESRIIFLAQGIRTSMFTKRETNLAERLGLKNKKVIIYAAHLGVAASDLDVVFEALKGLSREDARLLVIGDGVKLSYYKGMAVEMGIKDRVVFAGHVKHDAMPEYMSIADAAVNFMRDSPANRCRASIKIREYLAFGLPTICNMFGPDLENFRGFVYDFKAHDIKSFENGIVRALKNRDKKDEAKKYMQKWDWDTIARGFEKELEIIIGS